MNEPDIPRWALIRDMLIFQIKLAMDAIRDLLLSPASIVCGLIDIFKGHSISKSYFHKLMHLGQKSDSWLNLFGNHNNSSDNSSAIDSQHAKAEVNVDQLFLQVESLLKEQHGKGGLTASAKSTIDHYLNKIVETKTQDEQCNLKSKGSNKL
jgi:hypothetical protein